MTLLSIFACDSIAVPISSSFPATELRYILENSEAAALLSSRKFQEKAEETLKEGLDHISKKPLLSIVEKRRHGSGHEEVQLVHLPMKKGGMMLYTSGTTSRPVCDQIRQGDFVLTSIAERCSPPGKSPHRAGPITPESLGIHKSGPFTPHPSPAPHPWYR